MPICGNHLSHHPPFGYHHPGNLARQVEPGGSGALRCCRQMVNVPCASSSGRPDCLHSPSAQSSPVSHTRPGGSFALAGRLQTQQGAPDLSCPAARSNPSGQWHDSAPVHLPVAGFHRSQWAAHVPVALSTKWYGLRQASLWSHPAVSRNAGAAGQAHGGTRQRRGRRKQPTRLPSMLLTGAAPWSCKIAGLRRDPGQRTASARGVRQGSGGRSCQQPSARRERQSKRARRRGRAVRTPAPCLPRGGAPPAPLPPPPTPRSHTCARARACTAHINPTQRGAIRGGQS